MAAVRVGFLGLSLLLSGSLDVVARQASSPCDAGLDPAAGELGYRLRERASRCEGLYRSPITGSSLELVSLQQGSLRFDLRPNTTLSVMAASGIKRLTNETIKVRAVALPIGTYYRLDGVVSPQTHLNWPVGEVLLPARLSDNQVGIFGWIGSGVDPLFVPLRTVQAGGRDAGSSVVLKIRSIDDRETILWRSYPEDGRSVAVPEWTEARTSIRAGEAVTIELPEGPETVLAVDIRAKDYDIDRWASLRIRLLRPARP